LTISKLAENSKSLQSYVNEILEDHIEKIAFLRRYAPHLSVHKVDSKEMSIIDEHIDKIVHVVLKDNRLWCSEDKPKLVYMYFTPYLIQKCGCYKIQKKIIIDFTSLQKIVIQYIKK